MMDKDCLQQYLELLSSLKLLIANFLPLHIHLFDHLHSQHNKLYAIPSIQLLNAINCINIVNFRSLFKHQNKIHNLNTLNKFFFQNHLLNIGPMDY